ncbi:MAG: metal ABC transporter permease [Natronomonas sp.]
MITLSASTDDERSLPTAVVEWLSINREPALVVLAMALLLAAAGVFVYGPFPFLYELFWSGACGATGSFLFCSGLLQNGFTAGILIGIAAPLVGTYLVNRQMALVGEALAHTAFGGVAIGLFIGATVGSIEIAGATIPLDFPLLWALLVATASALGLQYLAVTSDEYADVPLAVVLTGGFAVGVAVISFGDAIVFGREVEGFLFGNILFVPFENVQLMVGLALLTLGLVGLTHKQLLFITFDREAARLARIHVRFYDTLLIIITALVVVAAMQILGAILVAAMLVVPVAAAMQVTTSFNRGLLLAVGIGEIAVVGGLVLSYRLDIAAGAAIVLVAIAFYLLAVFSKKL